MSTTYKTFLDDDIVTSRTLLHENIPMTASILGDTVYAGDNIKSYIHHMFQSVYDYPHTSSAANHLFDLSVGLTSNSPGSSSADTHVKKKINMYTQMAQVLVGYDADGTILKFDKDGDQVTGGADDKYTSVFVVNLSRLLVKDEVKKNTFKLTLGLGDVNDDVFSKTCLISDVSASTNYKVNSPTGEYGILYASEFTDVGQQSSLQAAKEVGLIFYQAGVAIISTNIFAQYDSGVSVEDSMNANLLGQLTNNPIMRVDDTDESIQELFQNATIEEINDAFRKRIANLALNNTTELNSTIHFCRVAHSDFNYSSNPTYLKDSKIVVKNKTSDAPISYITTVGLYSPDNELLAVAKLSEPIKKDPTQELILRVRLDY